MNAIRKLTPKNPSKCNVIQPGIIVPPCHRYSMFLGFRIHTWCRSLEAYYSALKWFLLTNSSTLSTAPYNTDTTQKQHDAIRSIAVPKAALPSAEAGVLFSSVQLLPKLWHGRSWGKCLKLYSFCVRKTLQHILVLIVYFWETLEFRIIPICGKRPLQRLECSSIFTLRFHSSTWQKCLKLC